MSDPVTNVQIEDVLSSIRRLVSVDNARARRAEGGAPPASQKLVLTQDYRIAPDAPVAPAPAAPPAAPAAQATPPASDYTRSLERRIAELEAAVAAQSAEFEPDGSEDTAQHRPTAMPFAAPAPEAGAGALQDQDSPAPRTVSAAAPAPHANDPDDIEALVAVSLRLAQPDAPDAAAPPAGMAEDAPPADTAEDAPMWSDDDPDVLGPDLPGGEDGIEVLEAERHGRARPAGEDDRFRLAADDAVIDEDTLRDMVAEIVRDELQGALGERITRNVRKLVRREIMRAISIRDFE